MANYKLPMYPESEELGDKGVRMVESIFCDEFRWIFRQQEKNDLGIDAQIEIIDDNRKSNGKLIALQIKCGVSFFKRSDNNGYIFQGDSKHLLYWLDHALPVILILCNPKDNKCFWVEVTRSNTTKTKDSWKITIPFSNILNITYKHDLETIANQLRHEDIIELSLHKYLYDRYNGKIKICPDIHIPRDFNGLSFIAQLNSDDLIIGFKYNIGLGFNIREIQEIVTTFNRNMKSMAWDEFTPNAKFYLYLISESREALNLNNDIIAFLKNHTFIKYFRMLYTPKSFYSLDNIDENWEAYFE